MGVRSLEIVAEHDSTIILDQWESLYQRLITEFADVRKRKRGLPSARKLAGFARNAATPSHKIQASDLALDKGNITEE